MADRQALTLRGVERAYGISRGRLAEAIRNGELRAYRIGANRFTILLSDVQAFLAKFEVRPTAAISSRADEICARHPEAG